VIGAGLFRSVLSAAAAIKSEVLALFYASGGAELVRYVQTGAGAVVRTILAKLLELPSVNDYGAACDGVTPDNAAVHAMIAAHGYARFTKGVYCLETDTFDDPMKFEHRARITVPAANTLTIMDRIESPVQQIFEGAGSVLVGNDGDSGEESRVVHAAWFGAYTAPFSAVDQAPFLQKAINALGNSREGVVLLETGNYHVRSGMLLNRCVEVRGQGTRRTVIRLDVDGYDVFTSAENGAKLSELQFEVQGPGLTSFNGKMVNFLHARCEAYNLQVGQGPSVGIYIAANDCRVDNIAGHWLEPGSAGSSLVQVASGGGNRISNVGCSINEHGPAEALVKIGGGGVVSSVILENIQQTAACPAFLLDASAGNIGRVVIDGVIVNTAAGVAQGYVGKLVSSGAFGIADVHIKNIQGNAYPSKGIVIEQNSTGTTEDISLDGVNISGTVGTGLELIRTAGTLRQVKVSETCDFAERATPISYSGTMSEISVAPSVTPNANAAYCYAVTVPDDGVGVLTLNRNVFGGVALVHVAGTVQGIYYLRAATAPAISPFSGTAPVGTIDVTAAVLTGTTGADGRVTIGVQPGVIYLENRLGTAQTINLHLLSGNK
jgi:hypothetical protein